MYLFFYVNSILPGCLNLHEDICVMPGHLKKNTFSWILRKVFHFPINIFNFYQYLGLLMFNPDTAFQIVLMKISLYDK